MARILLAGKKNLISKSGLVLCEAITVSDESSRMRQIGVYEMLQRFLWREDLVSKSVPVLCELKL